MPTPTPERLAKLPQWAQDHVDMLESRIEERTRQVRRLEERLAPAAVRSNVFAGSPYSGVREALGMWTPVTFGAEEHRGFEVRPEEDEDARSGMELRIRSSDGTIQVQPVSGNVVKIRGVSF